MRRGDVVAIVRGYSGRKVAVVLGPSMVPGKVRVAVLRAVSRRWTQPVAVPVDALAPAPDDWPATRLARRLIAAGGLP